MAEQTNGALPASRQAAVEQGLQYFNETAAERDALRIEVARLNSDVATHKVAAEALSAQIADMESRVQTATMMRDQAVGERAVYEALFISVQAQLRAFKIPAAPLIKVRDTEGDERNILERD
jgi:hypothetical protein